MDDLTAHGTGVVLPSTEEGEAAFSWCSHDSVVNARGLVDQIPAKGKERFCSNLDTTKP